jgi:hypothetical protein
VPRSAPLVAALAAASLAGCYHVGQQPEAALGRIAVPLFDNRTLRRELEVMLTRDVRREVLETTALQLAPEGEAERVLRGTIVAVQEGVLIAGPQEQVLDASLTVSARFGVYDDAGKLVQGEDADADGAPDAEWTRVGYAEYSPSRGQSRDTAADEALRDLAEQVVAELQAREDDRWEDNDDAQHARPIGAGRQLALIQRDEDWFAVAVPSGQELVATLYHSVAGLRLEAKDERGGPLPDARVVDEDRLVTVPAAQGARTVLLRVTGDDQGREYRLRVRVTAPRPE